MHGISKFSSHRTIRLSLMGSAAFLALAMAGSATAQSASAEAEMDTIVVTGTAIRGVAPVGSATVDIGRETLLDAPARSASDLLNTLPQASGLGTTLAQSRGGRAGVNLRGLGNNATLLMIDSHRSVSQGVTSQLSDPNAIPFAAIERVEVVTDGASAVYGSDAVAGVVNYILRKPFDGLEMTGRYEDSLYKRYSVEAVGGYRWGSGGILVGGAYQGNGMVSERDHPRLYDDLTRYGGNDSRLVGTTVVPLPSAPALIANRTVYGLPSGLNGRVPTVSELVNLTSPAAGTNPDNYLYERSNYRAAYSRYARWSGIVRIQQDFGTFGELNLTGIYSKRTTETPGTGDGAFTNIALTIRPGSPWYIPGLGSGNQTLVYNFRENNPDRDMMRKSDEKTFNLFADYKVNIYKDFQFTFSGTYGVNNGCDVCQPQANTFLTGNGGGIAFDSAPGNPNPDGSFNPYLTGPQQAAEGVFGIFDQRAKNRILDGVVKVDGTLLSLPGGDVKVAVGYEHQDLYFRFRAMNSLNATTTPQISRDVPGNRRNIDSLFAELYVPFFGPENARPGLEQLTLSVAGRYDHYNDVGSAKNPKFGLTWKPVDDLRIRGSYGKAFRAPTLGEADPRTIGQTNRVLMSNGLTGANLALIPVTNAATGQTLMLQRGGNSGNLRPETASIWSLGADFTPNAVPNLKMSLTYYNVNYKDRIQSLPNVNLILSNDALFELYRDYVIVAPQPSTCVNGGQPGLPGQAEYATYNPAYLPFLSDPNAVYSPNSTNDCSLQGIIRGGQVNLGRQKQSGLDLTVDYSIETPIGRAGFNGSMSKILQLKRSLTSDSELFSALDTIQNQVSLRGRAALSLQHGPFFGNLAMNYVGSYLNNATITVRGVKYPDIDIPAWTTFDLRLAWTAPDENGPLSGVRLGFNIQNLFDRDAPLVLSGTNSYDVANANIYGRTWSVEISKRF